MREPGGSVVVGLADRADTGGRHEPGERAEPPVLPVGRSGDGDGDRPLVETGPQHTRGLLP
ncbi:hypothetical protein SAMN05660657_03567 [Geodermatophilus amargosae]|uniref:Uncharacterized protein n=1 Tax=Geodermatophilus amargosae TaxID=1296565 RepID=A0A1I7BH47_9ACTN|nr:hypothetical protein SAMN05660657_03567 [Geodermatophilus amargosae]